MRRWGALLLLLATVVARAAVPETEYTVSVRSLDRSELHVHVRVDEPGEEHVFWMPRWYALYQIRDFARSIRGVRASDDAGRPLPVTHDLPSRWSVRAAGPVSLDYDATAASPGPFGAEIDRHHAFLNWAELLVYTTQSRGGSVSVRVSGLPSAWKAGTPLPVQHSGNFPLLHAASYDALIDSPLELGAFRESSFRTQGGTVVRVLLDGDPAPASLAAIASHLKRMVEAAATWMGEEPLPGYVFLIHVSDRDEGGMEHADGSALAVSHDDLRGAMLPFDLLAAHEFVHRWNVKRIRPSSLALPDYENEVDTRSLWFSEGVTSTVSDLVLLRAGLMSQDAWLKHLARRIAAVETRPARGVQSAEEAGAEAWFEGDADYLRPARSVSYYDEGELLGVLLDLELRSRTGGRRSLRDLMISMNRQFGRTGRPFGPGDIQASAEALCACPLEPFFGSYVRGTQPYPYEELFGTVGLRLAGGASGGYRVLPVPNASAESLAARAAWLASAGNSAVENGRGARAR